MLKSSTLLFSLEVFLNSSRSMTPFSTASFHPDQRGLAQCDAPAGAAGVAETKLGIAPGLLGLKLIRHLPGTPPPQQAARSAWVISTPISSQRFEHETT